MPHEREDDEADFVRIVVPAGHAGAAEGEWLWGERLGPERCRVDSSPFFAYGLSRGDVVLLEPGAAPQRPVLGEVERKGGHRTLRLALDPRWDVDRPEIQALLDGLLALGCSYEALPPQLAALDLPPEVDEERVLARLEQAREEGVLIWEWADPRLC